MNEFPLHVTRLGNGPKVLLAFHGIGQDGAGCFQSWAELLGHQYTIYAFDLFFHGKSNVTHHELNFETKLSPLTKERWQQLMQTFILAQKLTHFDLVGFSMGGRFALATAEGFPAQCRQLFLLAPDGVSEHPLYRLATRFSPVRAVFRYVMQHPAIMFSAMSLAQKMSLIPVSTARFVKNMLQTPTQRDVIYQSWVHFRRLRFSIPELYEHLQTNHVKLWLFVGTRDTILPARQVKALARLLPKNQVVILECGHAQLVAKAARYLLQQNDFTGSY
ncbi:alpha/beta fold hydrolase [Arundinibacter roseus]|nr:alpha/beta hydrolase [Arundinibacter roseus]